MYVYFCSLHVSGSHVPIIRTVILSVRHLVLSLCVHDRLVCRSIIRRIVVSVRHLVYVTLCTWPSGMQEHYQENCCISATPGLCHCVHDRLVCRSIIRRTALSVRHLVYVTLCTWPSGMQEHMFLHTRRSSTQSTQDGHLYLWWNQRQCNAILTSWWWAHVVETCRGVK